LVPPFSDKTQIEAKVNNTSSTDKPLIIAKETNSRHRVHAGKKKRLKQKKGNISAVEHGESVMCDQTFQSSESKVAEKGDGRFSRYMLLFTDGRWAKTIMHP